MRFDHGATCFTASDPDFAAMLDGLADNVADWDDGAGRGRQVGRPGMAGLVRAMAAGLDLRHGVTVTGVRRSGDGWQVDTGDGAVEAARVVVTVPAPQVAPLIGGDHPLASAVAAAELAPCLTLMAAFPADAPAPFVTRASDEYPLAWIARDSAKPGRPGTATTWVVQASPGWSDAHLDDSKDTIVELLLPRLCEVIGTAPGDALYAAGHRWRHARVTRPLGRAFLRDETGTLHLGGDWCLGARVEAAWHSGVAIARDILSAGPAR